MACNVTRTILCRNILSVYERCNVASYSCASTLVRKATPQYWGHYEKPKVYFAYPMSPYCKQFSTSPKLYKDRDDHEEKEKKLTLFQKFKKMYKEYWYVLVPVHLITSAGWFGSFYYMAKRYRNII